MQPRRVAVLAGSPHADYLQQLLRTSTWLEPVAEAEGADLLLVAGEPGRWAGGAAPVLCAAVAPSPALLQELVWAGAADVVDLAELTLARLEAAVAKCCARAELARGLGPLALP